MFSNILSVLSLTELGMDTAMNFKLYKPLAEHDEKRVRVLMKFYRDAYRVIGIVIICLGLCVLPLFPVLIKDYNNVKAIGVNLEAVFLLLLCECASSYLFFASRSAIVKADQRTYLLTVVDYFANIIKAVLQITALICFKNFLLFTTCGILGAILRNVLNAIIAKKHYAYAVACFLIIAVRR